MSQEYIPIDQFADNNQVQIQQSNELNQSQDDVGAGSAQASVSLRDLPEDQKQRDSTSSEEPMGRDTKRLFRVACALGQYTGNDERDRKIQVLGLQLKRMEAQIDKKSSQGVNIYNNVAPNNGNNIETSVSAENSVEQNDAEDQNDKDNNDYLFGAPWFWVCYVSINQVSILPFWQILVLGIFTMIRVAIPNTCQNENMWAVNIFISAVLIIFGLSQKIRKRRNTVHGVYETPQWGLLLIFMEMVAISYHGVGQFLVSYQYVSNSPQKSRAGIFHVKIPDVVPLIGSMWVGKLLSTIPFAQTYMSGEQYTKEERKLIKLEQMVDSYQKKEIGFREKIDDLSEASDIYIQKKTEMLNQLASAEGKVYDREVEIKYARERINKVFFDLINMINDFKTDGQLQSALICYDVFTKLYVHAETLLPRNIKCGILLDAAQRAGNCKATTESIIEITKISKKGAGQAQTDDDEEL